MPVPSFRGARAAVSQVLQDQQPLIDAVVAGLALDVRDEADAAAVVLTSRVVQTGGVEQDVFRSRFERA
jgi:hypothetical protein